CAAPPSGRSSRSTEVSTTYFRFISATASPTLAGSSGSSHPCGLPVDTEQNLHARVHTEPISISVAVPRPQHSSMLGHLDSAHTVDSLWVRTMSRISSYFAPTSYRR